VRVTLRILDKICRIREKVEDHSLFSSSSTFIDFTFTMEMCGFFCTWSFGRIKEEVWRFGDIPKNVLHVCLYISVKYLIR
jgi:hypothetical protein